MSTPQPSDVPRNRIEPSFPSTQVARTSGRVGLAPFRTLAALNRPARAARRTVRVLVRVAGCAWARCELPEFDVHTQWGSPAFEGVHRIVDIPGREGAAGRLEIHADEERARALEHELAGMAHTLGTLAGLHRNLRVNDGLLVSAGKVHLLANIANSLCMQLLVIEALHEKGRPAESKPFVAKAVAQCERLEKFIAVLHQR